MNFWNNLFLSGVRNFSYGSINIEWPNGKIEKIYMSTRQKMTKKFII